MIINADIEITYGDIDFQLLYTPRKGADPIPIEFPKKPNSQTINRDFSSGPAQSISITGRGRKKAKFTIKIVKFGVDCEYKVNSERVLEEMVLFNVN